MMRTVRGALALADRAVSGDRVGILADGDVDQATPAFVGQLGKLQIQGVEIRGVVLEIEDAIVDSADEFPRARKIRIADIDMARQVEAPNGEDRRRRSRRGGLRGGWGGGGPRGAGPGAGPGGTKKRGIGGRRRFLIENAVSPFKKRREAPPPAP